MRAASVVHWKVTTTTDKRDSSDVWQGETRRGSNSTKRRRADESDKSIITVNKSYNNNTTFIRIYRAHVNTGVRDPGDMMF
jgi:hypothetical protein